jgi:hypothetical protein
MAGMPEMQEQFPAWPWMAGMPEMQEQFPVAMDGRYAGNAGALPAWPWMAGMPKSRSTTGRKCRRL